MQRRQWLAVLRAVCGSVVACLLLAVVPSFAHPRDLAATGQSSSATAGVPAAPAEQVEQWVNLISGGNNYAATAYNDTGIDALSRELRSAGIDGVSLSITWAAFENVDQTLKPEPIANLRRIARRLLGNGLDVALDFHTLFNEHDNHYMVPALTPAARITLSAPTPAGELTVSAAADVFTSRMADEQWQIWEGYGSTQGVLRITRRIDARHATGQILRSFTAGSYGAGAWKLARGRMFDMWDPHRPALRQAYVDYVMRVMQHADATGLRLYQMPGVRDVAILNEPYLYWFADRPPFWVDKTQADATNDFHRVIDQITGRLRALPGWTLPIGVRFLPQQNPWRANNDIFRFSTPAATLARLDWIGVNAYWRWHGARPSGPWDNTAYDGGTSIADPRSTIYTQVFSRMAESTRAAGKPLIVTESGSNVSNSRWREAHFAWLRQRFAAYGVRRVQIWTARNDDAFWSVPTGGFNVLSAANTLVPGVGDQPRPPLTLTGNRPAATLSLKPTGSFGFSVDDLPSPVTTDRPAFARSDFGREIRAVGGSGIGVIIDRSHRGYNQAIPAGPTTTNIFYLENFGAGSYPPGRWEITDSRTLSRMLVNHGAINCNWGYPVTLTIPANTFSAGDVITLKNISRQGTVTIAAGGGVQLQRPTHRSVLWTDIPGQPYTTATITFPAPNTAVLSIR